MSNIHCYGIAVSALPTNHGTTIFAELTPATPLLIRHGLLAWHRGRSWKEPHIRWWFEIHETADETKEFPDNMGMHHYEFDGGATTLQGAIWRASAAVDAAIETSSNGDGSKKQESTDVQN